MTNTAFSEQDLAQIKNKGTSVARIETQIEQFKKGVPFMHLLRPCTPGDGITRVPDADHAALTRLAEDAQAAGRTAKFVPASGAASRMFKSLHAALENLEASQPVTDPEFKEFSENLTRFAFFPTLQQRLTQQGKPITSPLTPSDCLHVLRELLHEDRMNYGGLPKGLLLFHSYPDAPRTPVQEQLTEAVAYTESKDGQVRVHFTVSPEHQPLFDSLIQHLRPQFEQNNRHLDITFSFQKGSTDTIAVTPDNEPFRTDDGQLLFRPGGHGALIDNLNDLRGDIIYIKNIDNVVPDRLKPETIQHKKILAGVLIRIQQQLFDYLHWLDANPLTAEKLIEILGFASSNLGIQPAGTLQQLPLLAATAELRKLLNRPIRVCGMVKNEGEPGGGPFWVAGANNTQSIQIIELSQINRNDPDQDAIVRNSTHFNPVDLVCGVRDYQGNPFHLPDYVDPKACFTSEKSMTGRPLKALELPGLWNGAMSHWNTAFIEVPLTTFNPVKTVIDLLRPNHQ